MLSPCVCRCFFHARRVAPTAALLGWKCGGHEGYGLQPTVVRADLVRLKHLYRTLYRAGKVAFNCFELSVHAHISARVRWYTNCSRLAY